MVPRGKGGGVLSLFVKAPQLDTVQAARRLQMYLLGHQPVIIVNHRQHVVVLILVLEFQWVVCLELFLHTMHQLAEGCVGPNQHCPRINIMAFDSKLIRTIELLIYKLSC